MWHNTLHNNILYNLLILAQALL
ncbi:MAG: hypothetical protein LZF60_140028 [Nitrospira sp.]|nr:MAG: hypothetical protein LZF60_140028 [Nitrospira sp.]